MTQHHLHSCFQAQSRMHVRFNPALRISIHGHIQGFKLCALRKLHQNCVIIKIRYPCNPFIMYMCLDPIIVPTLAGLHLIILANIHPTPIILHPRPNWQIAFKSRVDQYICQCFPPTALNGISEKKGSEFQEAYTHTQTHTHTHIDKQTLLRSNSSREAR